MQMMCYRIGNWRAEARVDVVQADRLLAVISVKDSKNMSNDASHHTVVFEHQSDGDPVMETEAMMQGLLQARYGDWAGAGLDRIAGTSGTIDAFHDL